MTQNNFGEPMEFRPALPVMSDRQLGQVVTYIMSIDPTEARFEDIECALACLGKCLVIPCAVPNQIIKWLAFVLPARLIACEVICNGALANSANIHQKRLDSAIFALVALKDLQAEASASFSNVTPEEPDIKPHTQPHTQPEPKE